MRIPRALAVVLAALALGLVAVGCSSGATPATTTVAASTPPPTTINDFIPTNQDLSSCVGMLELPNCGSANKSDLHLYLTFAALMGGMALIGWRIAVAVRRRDREPQVTEHTF